MWQPKARRCWLRLSTAQDIDVGVYVQMGQGVAQWEQSLRACQEARGSTELLRALCTDLQNSVRLWLDLRLAQSPVSPTVLSHAIRAVQVCITA